MIKDLIKIAKGFQSSVNIEYDFNDVSKISSFIPTNAALEVIDNIISSASIGNDEISRAKILTGAYGRGKSLIVLVSLSILCNNDENIIFNRLIKKIRKVNEDLAKKIENYHNSNTRLLPVIISGNSGNMTQAFLSALLRSLNTYGLGDITPETHFEAAITAILRWECDYPDTYKEFCERISMSVDEFKQQLKSNSIDVYNEFVSIYPSLTAGSVFNPFADNNVVTIYEKVIAKLKEKGYDGIFAVYDEFGKYLESNIATASESETKMLQDFAEKCNREGAGQMHLCLICHKDISNYIDMGLSQDKVDGWKGISGRFEHINLTNNFSQMYEIIAHIIKKDKKKWENYRSEHLELFSLLYDTYGQTALIRGKEELVIEECYPLAPTTTFILPRLSELIAQNERTLFTFLSSNQRKTLRRLIDSNTDEFALITPDALYDYFENEFRKELSISDIYKIYNLSSSILRSLEPHTLSAKIIKCIATMHIIQQFERIAPTTDVLCDIYGITYDKREVVDCIQSLINEDYILYRKSSNDFLYLKESSGVDINREIAVRSASIKEKKDIQEIINLCIGKKYLYPISYNDDMCITRYFELRFISQSAYKLQISQSMPNTLAGIVFAIVPDNALYNNADQLDIIQSNDFRHVTIVPNNQKINTDVFVKYLAVKELREKAIGDSVLFDEYSLYLDDYSETVTDFISIYTSPEQGRAEFFHKGKRLQIRRKSQLNNLLSDICREMYLYTPIINNESLNKDKLPGMAINSRTKILTALLDNDSVEENLGLKGTGQDVSFMRSALIQTGILCVDDSGYTINLTPSDEKMSGVLNRIQLFFNDTTQSGDRSFADLYQQLTAPAYGIGLKLGVIPIYIAVVLHSIKNNLVFKQNGIEVKLTTDLLTAISEKPEQFQVATENWTPEKTAYLSALTACFSDFINDRERSWGSFDYIMMAINRWYLSLPKCSREMKILYDNGEKITKSDLKFVESLKRPYGGARSYLIDELPKIYGTPEVEQKLAEKIANTKTLFESGKERLIRSVIKLTIQVFGGQNSESLHSILNDWYEGLKTQTLEHLFPRSENAILALIANMTHDEIAFVEAIGKMLVGLRLNDWTNNTVERYESELKAFKKTVDTYNSNANTEKCGTSQFKMIITTSNGEERIRSFERIPYSERANLLFQDITAAIDEMGQSITEQEKRQILIDILTKMCE